MTSTHHIHIDLVIGNLILGDAVFSYYESALFRNKSEGFEEGMWRGIMQDGCNVAVGFNVVYLKD